MSKENKIFLKIIEGKSDRNTSFKELCYLLEKMGFQKRIKGDHHIYFRRGVQEIINIQPRGFDAKPYQVKQVRDLILKYKLELK